MYDAVDLDAIPRDAAAVAGYVGGRWPTFHLLPAKFPAAIKLSIAINADEDAQALDVERGDADPTQAPGWLLRQRLRGVSRPVVYASVSLMPTVIGALEREGIPRGHYRIWTAHFTGRRHRCSERCEHTFRDVAGATQWTDRALGRSLDASLVFDRSWFPNDGR
jgi:hypothetical protein